MKVICIDAEAWPTDYLEEDGNGKIVEGNIYDVIDSETDGGHLWYEISQDKDWWYYAGCFAPLSNIDETELLEQREALLQSL